MVLPANNTVSNADVVFTMPNPIVTGLVPASGNTGTQVNQRHRLWRDSGKQCHYIQLCLGLGRELVRHADYRSSSSHRVYRCGPGYARWNCSNRSVLFNVPAPTITSISPSIGGQGNLVTITGTGFHSSPVGSSLVQFAGGGGQATINSWSDTQIIAVVPNTTVTAFSSSRQTASAVTTPITPYRPRLSPVSRRTRGLWAPRSL